MKGERKVRKKKLPQYVSQYVSRVVHGRIMAAASIRVRNSHRIIVACLELFLLPLTKVNVHEWVEKSSGAV